MEPAAGNKAAAEGREFTEPPPKPDSPVEGKLISTFGRKSLK